MQLKPSNSVLAKRTLLNYLISFESVLLVLLTIVAVQVRNIGEELALKNDVREYVLLISFPVIWLCCLSLFGAWDIKILDNHLDGYRRLLRSSFMTFLAFSSASYLFNIQISRFVILISLVGGTILHLILRWIFLRIVDMKLKPKEIKSQWLVLGQAGKEVDLVHKLGVSEKIELRYKEMPISQYEFSKWVDEVTLQITLSKCSKVLLADPQALSSLQIEQLLWSVQQTSAEFLVYDRIGLTASHHQLSYSDGISWISIGEAQISDSRRVLKRLFDLILVVPSIVLLFPLFLTIALLIKIDSHGKFLYTQERIGQNGILFKFPKFRSMRQGSDAFRLNIVGRPDEGMSERYKSDPRITRVGRVLRRFSLDELPQLWCVLKGSMSLVGPRPILPEEAPQLGDFHFRRQIAKPGLTGIWQVSGRKDTSWEERMALDIKYVQDWSLALDLILIAKTIRAIISGEGSY